jgi:uncharacterized phosphosugar-binding protein
MRLCDRYFEKVSGMMTIIREQELEKITSAGKIVAEVIKVGNVIHLFGSGHSDMLAKEVFQRAGSLACVNKITDPSDGLGERLETWGISLVKKYDLREGEAIIIFSNSGRNPSPVEIAEYCHDKGMKVIAVTSLNHSKATISRCSSGKKLYEVSDIVIDNHCETGDAAIAIPGMNEKSGPTSTVIGALIVNMIMLEAIECCIENGYQPPLVISQNLDNTDEHNKTLWEKYRARIGAI